MDGALPGIIMWADPSSHLNEEYRQEYYKGQAEDQLLLALEAAPGYRPAQKMLLQLHDQVQDKQDTPSRKR